MKTQKIFHLTLLLVLILTVCGAHPVAAMVEPAAPSPLGELKAEIINCDIARGWCSKRPQVLISAVDPNASIKAIEGMLNGISFHADGKSHTLPLPEVINVLSYWGISSSGSSLVKQYLTFRLESKNIFSGSPSVLHKVAQIPSIGRAMLIKESGQIINDASVGNTGAAANSMVDVSSALGALVNPTIESVPHQIGIGPGKIETKVISYIFKNLLGRKQPANKQVAGLPELRESIAFILDDTPPALSILPQKSFSGLLTFSGSASDDVTGMKSLMVKINGDWQPLELQDKTWKYAWDTERARISDGAFEIQVKAEDNSGNQTTRFVRFSVLNRIWPVITLSAFLLALGLAAVFDPRHKAWREFSLMISRMISLQLVDLSKEDE
jgi:hypothetical protein